LISRLAGHTGGSDKDAFNALFIGIEITLTIVVAGRG